MPSRRLLVRRRRFTIVACRIYWAWPCVWLSIWTHFYSVLLFIQRLEVHLRRLEPLWEGPLFSPSGGLSIRTGHDHGHDASIWNRIMAALAALPVCCGSTRRFNEREMQAGGILLGKQNQEIKILSR